jgi:hypothetical protein
MRGIDGVTGHVACVRPHWADEQQTCDRTASAAGGCTARRERISSTLAPRGSMSVKAGRSDRRAVRSAVEPKVEVQSGAGS